MKLVRLKINQQYKSLNAFEYNFKEKDVEYDNISPICLVGLNGSGKSNIIEALSEIFCFLDLYCLNYTNVPKWAMKSPLSFEIEYLLSNNNRITHVRIESKKNKGPELYEIDEHNLPIEIPLKYLDKYLPNRILGYSSGHNEIISFPYFRNQGFYAEEVAKQAFGSDEISKNKFIPHTKTLYMNYDSNALILLANWLFQKKQSLEIYNRFIRIQNISSFRILINLNKGEVKLTNELKNIISNMQKCSLLFEYNEEEKKWEMDYVFNSATRKAFQETFNNAQNFFSSIYKLSLLNALSITKPEREYYIKKKSKGALLEKPPSAPKEKKVFCIDQLKLVISSPHKEIDYVGISDGEHQFIHIIGTLMLFNETNNFFLFDEPESHYNPKWRSHFVKILNDVSNDKNQEFVLATHSPFVVSGCRKENVIKFVRDGDQIHILLPKRETYGNSFEFLLRDLFELESSIAHNTINKLNKIINKRNVKEMEEAALEFAESREKRLLYKAIEEVEKSKE